MWHFTGTRASDGDALPRTCSYSRRARPIARGGEEPRVSRARGRQAAGKGRGDLRGRFRAFASGEVIVVLERPTSRADLRDLKRENYATVEEAVPRRDVNVIDLPPDLSVTAAVQAYEGSPDVAYAEPNFRTFPSAAPNAPITGTCGPSTTSARPAAHPTPMRTRARPGARRPAAPRPWWT